MTDDLAAFLRARLDEDEAAANATTPGPWMAGAERAHLVDNVVYGQSEWPDHIQQVCNVNYAQHKAGNATHIARHDPARALREVAAKRAILDGYEVTRQRYDSREEMGDLAADRHRAGEVFGLKFAVQVLGAVYSDHPDYRQEWAP